MPEQRIAEKQNILAHCKGEGGTVSHRVHHVQHAGGQVHLAGRQADLHHTGRQTVVHHRGGRYFIFHRAADIRCLDSDHSSVEKESEHEVLTAVAVPVLTIVCRGDGADSAEARGCCGSPETSTQDLSKLNRDPAKVIYLSGHALETCLQCENALPIKPWKLEPDDTALLDLIPFLEYVARHHPHDLREVLASYHGEDVVTEFRKRTKEHQRRLEEQKQQGRFWRRAS